MITTLAPVYSQPSIYDGPAGRVHHGYSTAKATEPTDVSISAGPGGVRDISKAWYAKLESGGFIVPHIDQGPWLERWHYPISGDGYCWQEGEIDEANFYPRGNMAYAIRHYELHAVWNPFDEPRVILIVEYDNPVDQPTTDLIIGPMITQIQEMIDAL